MVSRGIPAFIRTLKAIERLPPVKVKQSLRCPKDVPMNDPDYTSKPPSLTKDRLKTEWNKVRSHNDRAHNVGAVGDLLLAQWLRILNAHRWTCHFCGGPYETLEHLKALHAGGGTTADNVVPCCRWCNEKRAVISFGLYSMFKAEEAGLHWLVADFYELYDLMGKIEARLARIKELAQEDR